MATIKYVDISDLVDVAEFGGVHSIRFDLESAAQMAEYLIAVSRSGFPGSEIADGLSTALVIRYCRAFVGGVRNSRHAKEALASLSTEQLSLHEALLIMRDKHVAHSVNAEEESRVVAQYFEETVEEEGFVSVSVQHGRTIGFGVEQLQMIAEIARTLVARLDDRIKIEEARLFPSPKSLSAKEILRKDRELKYELDTTRPDQRRKKP